MRRRAVRRTDWCTGESVNEMNVSSLHHTDFINQCGREHGKCTCVSKISCCICEVAIAIKRNMQSSLLHTDIVVQM